VGFLAFAVAYWLGKGGNTIVDFGSRKAKELLKQKSFDSYVMTYVSDLCHALSVLNHAYQTLI
jgi:hypothetical protein